jgi:hypothetical protein
LLLRSQPLRSNLAKKIGHSIVFKFCCCCCCIIGLLFLKCCSCDWGEFLEGIDFVNWMPARPNRSPFYTL